MNDSQTGWLRLSGSMMIVRYNPETESAEFVQRQRGGFVSFRILKVYKRAEGFAKGNSSAGFPLLMGFCGEAEGFEELNGFLPGCSLP